MSLKQIIEDVCGKTPIDNPKEIAIWESWYQGKVEGYHNYTVYNGQKKVDKERKTLNMPKTVSEDWADLLANEKTQITIPDNDKDKEKLQAILEDNDWNPMLNNAIEKSFALGNGFIVLGLKDFLIGDKTGKYSATKDTKVYIDFVEIQSASIISINHHRIVECAFVSENTDYNEVSIHHLNDKGEYVIDYRKCDKAWNDIKAKFTIETKSKNAWFYHIYPNINNNTCMANGFGMSIFANGIDICKGIDNKFDAFDNEFVQGRIRTFVSSEATKMVRDSQTNEMVQVFDPYDDTFYNLPEGKGMDDKPAVTIAAPQLRYDAFISGINMDLNLLCKKVGFGTERYKFDKGGIATATQIISENSDMARSLKKHENLLRNIIKKMVLTIREINNNFTMQDKFGDFGLVDIKIDFDDSIIEDKNAIRERDRADVNAGLMTEVEYRMKHYGETKEDAEEYLRENYLDKLIEKYFTALQNGVISPEEFVVKVWGKEDSTKAAYIEEHLKVEVDPMTMFDEINKNNNPDNNNEDDGNEDEE